MGLDRQVAQIKKVWVCKRQVLSEIALYYGDVAMPKDWDILDKLSGDILQSVIQNKQFPFSRTWDMLNTYMQSYWS